MGSDGESGRSISDAMAARAAALVPPVTGIIVPFAPPAARSGGLPELVRWTSLAAAVVFASWLGFTLGMDTSNAFGTALRGGDDGALNELIDPGTNLLRDLTEGSQT